MSGLRKLASLDDLEELLRNNEKVVVAFITTKLFPCRIVVPIIEKLAEQYTNILFVGVEILKHNDIAQAYHVNVPSTLLFFKNGKRVDDVVGADIQKYEQKIEAFSH